MHIFFKRVLFISICALTGCVSDDLEPTTSFVRIYISSTISKDKLFIGSTELGVFELFYNNMVYSSADTHSKGDSILTDTSLLLGGGFIHLNYYIGDFENRVDSTKVPNGIYSDMKFNIKRCPLPDVIQGMENKSVKIEGSIGDKPFRFWHNDTTLIKTYFPDGLLTISKGTPVDLMIYIDFNKVLDPQLGGVDLSKAADGNHDGFISIDPTNEDGNAELADDVFNAIIKNISCKKMN